MELHWSLTPEEAGVLGTDWIKQFTGDFALMKKYASIMARYDTLQNASNLAESRQQVLRDIHNVQNLYGKKKKRPREEPIVDHDTREEEEPGSDDDEVVNNSGGIDDNDDDVEILEPPTKRARVSVLTLRPGDLLLVQEGTGSRKAVLRVVKLVPHGVIQCEVLETRQVNDQQEADSTTATFGLVQPLRVRGPRHLVQPTGDHNVWQVVSNPSVAMRVLYKIDPGSQWDETTTIVS